MKKPRSNRGRFLLALFYSYLFFLLGLIFFFTIIQFADSLVVFLQCYPSAEKEIVQPVFINGAT